LSVPFFAPVAANGQSMSDMPGMEHEHHGGAAASHQPLASASRQKGRSRPASGSRKWSSRSALKSKQVHTPAQGGMHGQHAMPGMQHGEHRMEAMPDMQHGEHGLEAMPGIQHGEHGAMPGMQHGEH